MKITSFILFVVTVFQINAQVKIGDNPATNDANSLLELESTSKGFLIPRVTLNDATTVAPLSATIPTGMLIYNLSGSELVDSITGMAPNGY